MDSKSLAHTTYEVELEVPYCICTEVSQTDHIREDKGRHREYSSAAVSVKGVEIIEANACPDHMYLERAA